MADENEINNDQANTTESPQQQPGTAETAQQGAGASEDKEQNSSSTEAGASSPGIDSKDRDETFAVYQNALENVDWGYKLKSGDERDLGHKSMVIAERAYIAAYAYDSVQANKIYEQSAGKPPKEELLKRAQAAQATGVGKQGEPINIPDLTAGIVSIGERRDHLKNKSSKDDIEKKMGNWRVALGDHNARGRGHLKTANDQMLQQEKPREDGLHLIGAFKTGFRASHEYGAMFDYRRREREVLGTVREHDGAYKTIRDQIASFEKKNGISPQNTSGPNGQTAAKFSRAVSVVKSALAKAPGSAIPGASVIDAMKPNPGQAAQRAAAMMQNAGISR